MEVAVQPLQFLKCTLYYGIFVVELSMNTHRRSRKTRRPFRPQQPTGPLYNKKEVHQRTYKEIQVALQFLNWTTKPSYTGQYCHTHCHMCVRNRNTHRFAGKTSRSNVSIVSLTIIRVEEDN